MSMHATVYSNGITADIVRAHGLDTEEYKRALNVLGRPQNLVELGIFSVNGPNTVRTNHQKMAAAYTNLPRVTRSSGTSENAGSLI